MNIKENGFLFKEISSLKGVGSRIKKYLEKKYRKSERSIVGFALFGN